jgi:hypothetical protein
MGNGKNETLLVVLAASAGGKAAAISYFLFPIPKKNAASAAFFVRDPRLCRQAFILNRWSKVVAFRAL